MYAVIQSGGKQYKVQKGDAIQVELLPLDLGATANFSEILLAGAGAEVKVGQPFVSGASVAAEVVAIEKGPKIIVYHKKRGNQSDFKTGHRQPYTRLLITSVDNGSGQKETLSAEERKTILGRVGFANADAWELKEETLDAPAPKAKKAPAKKAEAAAQTAPAKKAAAPKAAAAKKTTKK